MTMGRRLLNIPPTLATMVLAIIIGFAAWLASGVLEPASPTRPPVSLAARVALEKKLPEVRFQDVALTEIVEFLNTVIAADLRLSDRAKEWAIRDKIVVSLRLRNVKTEKALRTIAAAASEDTLWLDADDRGLVLMLDDEVAATFREVEYWIGDVALLQPNAWREPDGDEDAANVVDLESQIKSLIRERIRPGSWERDGVVLDTDLRTLVMRARHSPVTIEWLSRLMEGLTVGRQVRSPMQSRAVMP